MTAHDAPVDDDRGPVPGVLRQVALLLTGGHLACTAVAVAVEGLVRGVIAVVFVAVFFVAIVVFVVAFFTAASRSRNEHVSVVGAFFLGDGSVSRRDRVIFTGAAVVQAIVGIAGASLRPFTAVAFGVLVSLAGLAMMAIVGARFGRFDPRS